MDLGILAEWRLALPQVSIDWRVWLAYALGVLILYLAFRLAATPLKEAVRIAFNVAAGIVILLLFNLVGGFFGLHVPLNPVTAAVAGLLGIPGVGLLVALQHVLA